jgi:glycosyltransferase involved in cell wall biosynthesis
MPTPPTEPRPRVALVAIVDFPNGVGGDTRRVHMLARALVAAGLDVTLVIPCPRGLVDDEHARRATETIDGIEVVRCSREGSYGHAPGLGAGGMLRLFALRWASLFRSLGVIHALRRRGLAVIHLYQPTFYDGAAYWLQARLAGVRVAADYCDLSFVDHDRIERNLGRRLWSLNYRWGMTWLPKRLDTVGVISRYLEELMAGRLRPGRLIRVPPVVDTAAFDIAPPDAEWRRAFGLPPGRVVVYAGSFFDNEGVPTLLDAAPGFLSRHPDASLVVVGGHPHDAWERARQRAAAGPVGDRIVFTGVRPSLDMPKLFRAADVLVAPKVDHVLNRAGVPTKLVEYLASGRPVVAGRVGDIPDIADHGTEALLVPPDDPGALAAAIDRLLAHPALADRIGRAGRDRVRRDYDVRPVGEKLRRALLLAPTEAPERVASR